MKHILNLIVAVALFALTAFNASAQLPPRLVFAGSGTAIGSTNSHYIVPANGAGAPLITSFDVTGDTGSTLRFYTASAPAVLTAATAASPGTNLTCVGSAFSANDTIVLWHRTADTYERLVVSTASASNVTTTAAIAAAAAAGDIIFKMSVGGSASGVTNTAGVQRYSAGGLFASDINKPILVQFTGTSAAAVNSVSGIYVK